MGIYFLCSIRYYIREIIELMQIAKFIRISTRGIAAVGAAACLLLPVSAWADSTYGGGSYSKCTFGTTCPTASSPAPATPETPVKAAPGMVITSNIRDNSVIRDNPQQLVAWVDQQNSDGTTTRLTTQEIGWVAFYVDNQLIGTQTTPNNANEYTLSWDTGSKTGTTLSIVAYSKNGDAIQRRDIPVSISISPQKSQPTTTTQDSVTPALTKANGFRRIILSPRAEAVTKSLPYWLLLVLLVIALRLWWQTVSEIRNTSRIRTLISREHDLLSHKQEFLNLISHYLRTPMTTLNGGIDLLQLPKDPKNGLDEITKAATDLATTIDKVIKDSEHQASTSINASSDSSTSHYTPLRTAPFWILIIAVVLLMLIGQAMALLFTSISYQAFDLVQQVFIVAAVIIFMLLGVRQLQLKRTVHDHETYNLGLSANLDRVRSDFIKQAADTIEVQLLAVETACKPYLQHESAGKFLVKGINDFRKIVDRLNVAAHVSSDSLDHVNLSNVSIHEIIAQCLKVDEPLIQAKKLQIDTPPSDVRLVTNHGLLGFVVASLIDNAARFNKPNGHVSIGAEESASGVAIHVADDGIGISEEKLTRIFEPFSRGTSTNQFDYEGMGFDLFLSNMILHRLGGTLSISSQPGNTVATINMPVSAA